VERLRLEEAASVARLSALKGGAGMAGAEEAHSTAMATSLAEERRRRDAASDAAEAGWALPLTSTLVSLGFSAPLIVQEHPSP